MEEATQVKQVPFRQVGFWGILGLSIVFLAFSLQRISWPLWFDEIWVARTLRDGVPFAAPVPPLFTLLAWMAARFLGYTDVSFRLTALLAGTATVLLPVVLLFDPRRERGDSTPYVWALFLAGSSPLAFYAAQLKQYTLDAFLAAAIVVLWLFFFRNPGSWERLTALGIVCLLGIVGSHTGVFVAFAAFSAAGAALLIEREMKHRRLQLSLLAVYVVFCSIAFVVVYLFFFRVQVNDHAPEVLERYWLPYFWDGSLLFAVDRTRHWTGHALNMVRFGLPVYALLAVVLLFLQPVKRTLVLVSPLVLPPLLVLVVSRFHLYPYGEVRLLLFALPGFYCLAALAFNALAKERKGWTLVLVMVFFVLYAFNGFVLDSYNLYMGHENTAALHRRVRSAWSPGVAVAAPHVLLAPLRFYHPEMETDMIPLDHEFHDGRLTAGPLVAFAREGDDVLVLLESSKPGKNHEKMRVGSYEVHFRGVIPLAKD